MMRLEPISRKGMKHLATISDAAEIAFLRGAKDFTVFVAEPDKPPYMLVMDKNGKLKREELEGGRA